MCLPCLLLPAWHTWQPPGTLPVPPSAAMAAAASPPTALGVAVPWEGAALKRWFYIIEVGGASQPEKVNAGAVFQEKSIRKDGGVKLGEKKAPERH